METTTNPPKSGTRKDVYQIVTEKIIEQLEKGTVPWRKPWKDAGIPRNLISKRPYRGINVMLLAYHGYEHNLFLTSKQLKDIGGSIRHDERPHLVTYWNYIENAVADAEKQENRAEQKKVPYLRYYTVFNVSQCEGISEKYVEAARQTTEIPSCEAVMQNMPKCPVIKHKEQKAYYNPLQDVINMPKKASFESDESYYATLFHELVHSTGHHSRLARKDLIQMAEFGTEPYSHEELVAEIGTCYLESLTGIESRLEQSAAYIQGWLQVLKNDKRFILSASTHAQKAIDFILNVQEAEEKHED